MKKKISIILTAALTIAIACVALAGCSQNSSSQQGNSQTAVNSQSGFTLKLGFDQSYPPYGFIGNDGSYTGFDIDLAKAVCEKKGWGLELVPIDWDAKDALLSQGNINCIWNGFTREGRESNYAFSDSYMLNEQVVVVKNNSGISSLDNLSGKTVMTQADSAALSVLNDNKKSLASTFSGGTVQTIGDYNNAFMQLESGMIDAVACDLSIAQYKMSQNSGKYEMIDEPLSQEHYAVGFKKGDDDTASQVTEALKQLNEDGTVKSLCEKYADYGMSYSNWVLK
jgi:polar amino acid transport system substrate-binding protein